LNTVGLRIRSIEWTDDHDPERFRYSRSDQENLVFAAFISIWRMKVAGLRLFLLLDIQFSES